MILVFAMFFLRFKVYDMTKRRTFLKVPFVGSVIKDVSKGIIVNVNVI